MKKIFIKEEFIRLDSALKLAGFVSTGGHAKMVIQGGEVLVNGETCLMRGKKLKKAKVSVTRNNEVWSGNFDADKFAFGSLALPEGEAQDDEGRFEERMESLAVLANALECYFNVFADKLSAPDFPEYQKKIQKWVLDRDEI